MVISSLSPRFSFFLFSASPRDYTRTTRIHTNGGGGGQSCVAGINERRASARARERYIASNPLSRRDCGPPTERRRRRRPSYYILALRPSLEQNILASRRRRKRERKRKSQSTPPPRLLGVHIGVYIHWSSLSDITLVQRARERYWIFPIKRGPRARCVSRCGVRTVAQIAHSGRGDILY